MISHQPSAISHQLFDSPRPRVAASPRRIVSPSPRSGFTLTELLVVIGVIAFLIAISVSIYSGTNTAARRSATVATIKKIDELLHTRIDGFNRWLATQGDTNIRMEGSAWDDDPGRSLILGRKQIFRSYFPQRFDEASSPISPGPSHDDITESSECLYYFLTHAEAYGAEPVGDDAFGTREVADTDGDGLKEFVDGWGHPLRFYRWPTRLIRRDGTNVDTTVAHVLIGSVSAHVIPQWKPSQAYVVGDVVFATTYHNRMYRCVTAGSSGSSEPAWPTDLGVQVADSGAEWKAEQDPFSAPVTQDPDDPQGLLSGGMSAADFEADFHTAETYHVPLVVSAGVDGLLGLYEPGDVSNKGHLAAVSNPQEAADDITNLNQRAGSR